MMEHGQYGGPIGLGKNTQFTGGGTTIQPAQPRESVQGELSQLADAVERVASAVGNLSMQLTPVLMPSPPSTNATDKDCQRSVPTVESIAEQRRRVDIIGAAVRDLADRLAL